MRPAKIGQLSVIDNRPQPIDRSDSLSAGAPVIPTALRAWFCGHNSNLSVGDVCDVDGGSKGNDSVVVIAARAQVGAVSSFCSSTTITTVTTTSPSQMIIQGVRTLTSLASDSENIGLEDDSTDNQINLDSRLSGLDLEIQEKDNPHNDKSFQCEVQCKSDDIGNTATSNSHGTSIQQLDKSSPDNSNCLALNGPESRDCLPSISNEAIVPRREYNDSNIQDSKLLADSNKLSDVSCRTSLLPLSYTNTNPRVDTQHSSSVDDCGTDMNVKESINSFLYTNFFNVDSSSSGDSHQPRECFSIENKIGRQEMLDTGGSHQNRLSHQYLNSQVTGQNFPSGLLNTRDSFRYLNADTDLVTCKDCTLQPNVLFTATPAKEMNPHVEGFNILQPSSPPSAHFHHYYNKSVVFHPLTADPLSPVSNRNKHNFHSTSKNVFISKENSSQGGKPHQDLDMALFQKVSQHHCPTQRSPATLPHHYLHNTQQYHQQDHEQQHLLNHCQFRHQERQYLQHHPYRHYSISSVSSLIHDFRCGRRWLHISPVSLLWAFLSVLVAGTCLLSFLTPYWTVHPDHVHSFGLFNLCIRDLRFSHPRPFCMNFGHQPYYFSTRVSIASASSNTTHEGVALDSGSVDIARIPSGAWQAACLLFGVGVFVQILGAMVSLVVLALHEPWHHRVALVNGYMQTVGVLLLVSGLLLYPVGFNSPFYTYYCDSSRPFCTGHCAMGWSYVTAIMTTAVSIFCPVMSSFVEAHHGAKKHEAIVETATA